MKIKRACIFLLLLWAAGCADNPNAPDPLPEEIDLSADFLHESTLEKEAIRSLVPDAAPDALLAVQSVYSLNSYGSFMQASAVFTHERYPVGVDRVTMNEQNLWQIRDLIYSWNGNAGGMVDEPNNLQWEVRGYGPMRYSKVLTRAKLLLPLRPRRFDTLRTGGPAEIRYEGFEGGQIFLRMAAAARPGDKPDTSSGKKNFFAFSAPDTGVVSLPADSLRALRAGLHYSLELFHFRYEQDTLDNGKVVGYITSNKSVIPVFLAE